MKTHKQQLEDAQFELHRKTDELIVTKQSLHKWKTRVSLYSIIVAGLIVGATVTVGHLFEEKENALALAKQTAKTFNNKLKELESEFSYMVQNSSLVYVSKDDLWNDLKTNYPDVSTKTKAVILETILSEAEKYNMNPLILYSLVFVESSFRHWLEHASTTIDKGGKKIQIRAVGLTGVVWEWWGDKLKEAGIAETRGDLFDPVTNIKAGAFVYNQMYHMDMHKSAKYKDESALLRYFGGDYVSYIQRIDAKIATFVRPNLYRKD